VFQGVFAPSGLTLLLEFFSLHFCIFAILPLYFTKTSSNCNRRVEILEKNNNSNAI
jgi:hypothetical protein